MKKSIYILVVLLIILGGVLLLDRYLSSHGHLTKEEDVQQIIQRLEKENASEKKNDSVEPDHKPDPEVVSANQEPKYVIESFFGAAMKGDQEMLGSIMLTEKLNQDLFKVSNPDKNEVIQNIMERITRQNTLKTVNVLNVDKEEMSRSVNVTVRLSYSEGFSTNLKIRLTPEGSSHDYGNTIFFVDMSLWELIELIEKE